MRLMAKAALAGLGAVALAGTGYAADRAIHTMNVDLPDGSVAQVHYVGDRKPDVRIVPVRVAAVPVAVDPMFVDFDRMFADMQRRHDAMMRQVAAMQQAMPVAADGGIDMAAFRNMPAGTVSYSYVSTTSGKDGTCTQSMTMASYGKDQQPKVEKKSSGDCTAMGQTVIPAVATPAPAPAKVVPAKAEKPAPKTIDPNTI